MATDDRNRLFQRFMVFGSVLTSGLEVAGVWGLSITFFGGLAGALELAFGGADADVGGEAARGAAAGFIIGIPLSISAALILAITS